MNEKEGKCIYSSSSTSFSKDKNEESDQKPICHISKDLYTYANVYGRRADAPFAWNSYYTLSVGDVKIMASDNKQDIVRVAKIHEKQGDCIYNRSSTPFSTDSIDLDSLEDE